VVVPGQRPATAFPAPAGLRPEPTYGRLGAAADWDPYAALPVTNLLQAGFTSSRRRTPRHDAVPAGHHHVDLAATARRTAPAQADQRDIATAGRDEAGRSASADRRPSSWPHHARRQIGAVRVLLGRCLPGCRQMRRRGKRLVAASGLTPQRDVPPELPVRPRISPSALR
jgi:hypothetical protein